MGPKITVDSATMMNKGFEIIEAMCSTASDRPDTGRRASQSVIHSMVAFRDGAVIAQWACRICACRSSTR
jgi:1-deoxy-D-xylulose-5-phosphate reductoisomerase